MVREVAVSVEAWQAAEAGKSQGNKKRLRPDAPYFTSKENDIQVSYRENTPKGKPTDKLVCLRDSEGHVFQVNVDWFAGNDEEAKFQAALAWTNNVARQLDKGEISREDAKVEKGRVKVHKRPSAKDMTPLKRPAAERSPGVQKKPSKDTKKKPSAKNNASDKSDTINKQPEIGMQPQEEKAKPDEEAPCTPPPRKATATAASDRPRIEPPPRLF